jgi:hypothetical protein
MKRTGLAAALLALWLPAVGADSIVVDLTAGTVAGVDMNQSGPALKKKLGARVKKTTEQLEGEPSELWIVFFGKAEVRKHWNGFSFTDPVFRTKEGLGVGSTVADFDKTYGQSTFSEEEGCHWIFEGKSFIFALESGCTNDRQQKVNEVWIAARSGQ